MTPVSSGEYRVSSNQFGMVSQYQSLQKELNMQRFFALYMLSKNFYVYKNKFRYKCMFKKTGLKCGVCLRGRIRIITGYRCKVCGAIVVE